MAQYLKDLFAEWEAECEERFAKVKANEEELNRIFIDIYGLQDELTPEVDDKDVTVRKADLEREIRSLISYAVGCMFGRYSLEAEGLQFAGGGGLHPTGCSAGEGGAGGLPRRFAPRNDGMNAGGLLHPAGCSAGEGDAAIYGGTQAGLVDEDGVIPIVDGNWFNDDIVAKFRKFLEAAFGRESLVENLAFIEQVIGKDIRKYFLNDFYKDHVKQYQKRPIYWLFSSPKGCFQALIYLHRYTKDTASIILNDYLRVFSKRIESERAQLSKDNLNLSNATDKASERRRIQNLKRIDLLASILVDLENYERKILLPLAEESIELDLDDGVKVNYCKLGKALKPIGLEKKEK